VRVIGIDEAGYGPLLGPLVNAATVWECPPKSVDADWWKLLAPVVARDVEREDWRLHVSDSKRVYNRQLGIGRLERAVRAFADLGQQPVQTTHDLLAAATGLDEFESGLPWYAGGPRRLPLDQKRAASRELVQKLADRLRRAGLVYSGCTAWPMAEDVYNAHLARTNNKADVLVQRVLTLLQHVLPDDAQDAVVFVDRLGGRGHHAELLERAFPRRRVTMVSEDRGRSTYQLCRGRSTWELHFVVDGDAAYLPIALASMYAKYTRELVMLDLNAYWQQLQPGLRPTAGYYRDAQRFIREIAPLVARAGLDPARFIRAA
jgi:ribonuclease HII